MEPEFGRTYLTLFNAALGAVGQRRLSMIHLRWKSADYGGWLLVVSLAAGLCLSVFDYFFGNGIDQTSGVLLVIVSTALMLVASFVLALGRAGAFWFRFIRIAILLDLIGTGLAAYLLEAHLLLATMVLGLIGWIVHFAAGPREGREISVSHAYSGEVS
jgi:hypothetical protein